MTKPDAILALTVTLALWGLLTLIGWAIYLAVNA
jgi:hypothetical protein